ncbi:MAG: hypothetical protein J6R92_05880 [Akkermansia sp.]|nr:hypothetical protein [Akkermansia sp.]
MKQKSITFRCSSSQHARLNQKLKHTNSTRTNLITAALECFLTYAEQPHISSKNLFELVQDVDAQSKGPRFEEQA